MIQKLKGIYVANPADNTGEIKLMLGNYLWIAMAIGMVTGVSFSLEAFKSIASNDLYDVCLVASVVGIFVYNVFFVLLKYISKLAGKDIDKYGNLIFVNIIFIAMIVFFVVLGVS